MSQPTRFVSISTKADITHKLEKFIQNVSENTLIDKEQIRVVGLNAISQWENKKHQKITAIYEMGERKKQRNIRKLAKLMTLPITSSELPKDEVDDLTIITHLELENMFRDRPTLIY